MAKEVMHFNSQKERLDYLRGDFEEIVPIEAKAVEEKEEKPKKAKKRGKKDDKVQTE